MFSNTPAAGKPQQEAPKPHTVVSANLFPVERVVQLHTRGSNLAIVNQETVLSYDVVEGLFLSMLQMRLAERGLAVGLMPQEQPGAAGRKQ